MRAELAKRGFKSVAAEGFESPGVVVVYSPVAGMVGKIKSEGLQLAGYDFMQTETVVILIKSFLCIVECHGNWKKRRMVLIVPRRRFALDCLAWTNSPTSMALSND